MYKVYFTFIIFIFLFSSCSSIQTQTQRDFIIYPRTPVTVVWERDPLGIGTMIEMKLLEIGVDAVPYEVAKRYVEQQSALGVQTYRDGLDAASQTRLSERIETPTAIVINFGYSWIEYALHSELTSFQCRILDLESQRVLAVISFQGGSMNSIRPRKAVDTVGEVILKRLRDR